MTPSLYATKISDLGKPVSEKAPKEKKPRSEKQIAAFEKAREARKKTLESKKSFEKPVETPASPPKTVSEPEVSDEVKVEIEKQVVEVKDDGSKESPKAEEKRKTKKRAAPKTEEVIEKSEKIETGNQTEEEAPTWFKSYVIGVKEEQAKANNDKRPKKQVRIEAKEVAHQKWQQPQTRERVQNTVNNHMQSMYSKVFPNRRL
jgi:hypothetical protein